MASRKSIAARNIELDALRVRYNSGKLRIYSGPQPATPETAPSGTLLVELVMNATAFAAATGGSVVANAIATVNATAAGTAGWFRLLESDGASTPWDGACGTSGEQLNFDSLTISLGAPVAISSFTLTDPQ